ncbi:STAS domain-containing protein [Streptosporangium roseum]|uniref:STAS domain-containing protein n=1 Tax=Streptosporangium roseum TaxID=2001 RepID=UPI003318F807
MRSAVARDGSVSHFSAGVTDYCGCSVIVLDGDLDALSAPLLRQVLGDALARGRTRLVIDAAKLTFCDSTGIWALAEGHQRAVAAGGRAADTGLRPRRPQAPPGDQPAGRRPATRRGVHHHLGVVAAKGFRGESGEPAVVLPPIRRG